MEKFQKFALSREEMRAVYGGDNCLNCLESAIIACDASCGPPPGTPSCPTEECYSNQMVQCYAMYCHEQ
jgi:hypothetical protein